MTSRRIAGLALAIAAVTASAPAVVARPPGPPPVSPPLPPLVIAGGALDPAFAGADVYAAPPTPATPRGRACRVAQEYVDLINAGRFDRVVTLFEPDAIVMEPSRTLDRGHAQIAAFYDERMRRTPPKLIAVALVGDGTDCMLEIAAERQVRGTTRHTLVSVDHFTLGRTGKIARMVAFARPPRTE